jgi:hypothetical protein
LAKFYEEGNYKDKAKAMFGKALKLYHRHWSDFAFALWPEDGLAAARIAMAECCIKCGAPHEDASEYLNDAVRMVKERKSSLDIPVYSIRKDSYVKPNDFLCECKQLEKEWQLSKR